MIAAASRSNAKSTKTSSRTASTGDGANSLSALLTSGLSSSFEAIRDKLSQSVTENGEEYLKEAAEKITKSTSQMVEWSKKNPIKLAIGAAALVAVSAFLIHTMKSQESGTVKRAASGVKRLVAKAKSATARATS